MDALREWTLNAAADVLNCELVQESVAFSGISIDTRTIKKGDLFVAIVGENFDGNDYVVSAKEKGAIAAIVSKDVDVDLPRLKVSDTRIALGELAHAHRMNFRKPVIGLTGSNGKTTVKELLSAILAECGAVLSTNGNFNNDIGLPLTLLRLQLDEDYAVIEMGANHPGEIAYLSKLTAPDVAILNNAGAAHLEGFGSIEGVAKAKGEIFENLGEDGVAIINLDDTYADYWISQTQHCKRIGFGIKNANADVSAQDLRLTASGVQFVLCYGEEQVEITLPLFGEHNVMNALAACAAANALNVPLSAIKDAFKTFEPVGGRLKQVVASNGAIVLDDTYNANPSSMKAGIDVVAAMGDDAVLVMGDMLEGGESQLVDHESIGQYAREAGIKKLFALGSSSQQAAKAFGEGARHYATHAQLIEDLKKSIDERSVLLVKGSRGMKMEQVVQALVGKKRGD